MESQKIDFVEAGTKTYLSHIPFIDPALSTSTGVTKNPHYYDINGRVPFFQRPIGSWTMPEKSILRAAVASYGLYADMNKATNTINLLTVPWAAVAFHLPGRHAMECLAQWRALFPNSNLKKATNGVLYISKKPVLKPFNCHCQQNGSLCQVGKKRKKCEDIQPTASINTSESLSSKKAKTGQ